MSSQGPVPGAGNRDFGLIETFRWSRADGYDLFPEHLARLGRSADALGFAFAQEAVEKRLQIYEQECVDSESRVRLVVAHDGSIALSGSPLGKPPASYRVAVALPRHPSADPLLRHKTTLRDRYERPLEAAMAASCADEVLFLNEHGELCEGARSNLFVRHGARLLTPPLACGLLPGTLRARLLATGEAREGVLRLDDLAAADEWYLGNSVRGLVPSTLIA